MFMGMSDGLHIETEHLPTIDTSALQTEAADTTERRVTNPT
jgi:hypothetical protein